MKEVQEAIRQIQAKKLSESWRSKLLVFMIVAYCLSPSGYIAAQTSQQPEYERLIKEAISEYSAGHHEEACSLFRQAHRIQPNARTLRGLGMASFRGRKYVDAVVALRGAIDETRKPLTDKLRRQAQEILERAEGFIGYFDLLLVPESAILSIDGQKPIIYREKLIVDPGKHEVVARAQGYETQIRQVSVRGGSTVELEISLKPIFPDESTTDITTSSEEHYLEPRTQEQVEGSEPLPWILLSTSGAFAIGGGIMLGLAMSDKSSVENAKEDTPFKELKPAHDRVPVFSAVGFVLLGVGIAGASAGIILLGTADSSDGEQTDVVLMPNGLAVQGSM